MKIFDYDIDVLNNNFSEVVSKIRKYRGILKDIPKVYFVIDKTKNELIYIGSSRYDLFTRIYAHLNESINMVRNYNELGHVRPEANDYKKTRTFCDLIYSLNDFEVSVFGQYNSVKDAEIVEKALIFYTSNFNMDINLCNASGVKSLSINPIKKI